MGRYFSISVIGIPSFIDPMSICVSTPVCVRVCVYISNENYNTPARSWGD